MKPLAIVSCLALTVPLMGCQVIAQALADELVATACDEDADEGRDRRELDRLRTEELRALRRTPLCHDSAGEPLEEIEGRLERQADSVARDRFHEEHGRAPNLNWHAR